MVPANATESVLANQQAAAVAVQVTESAYSKLEELDMHFVGQATTIAPQCW
jgi:hypothetical protein